MIQLLCLLYSDLVNRDVFGGFRPDLQQVEQVLVGLQSLSSLSAQSLQSFTFLHVHHVRQLLLVLLRQFLTVRNHFLFRERKVPYL